MYVFGEKINGLNVVKEIIFTSTVFSHWGEKKNLIPIRSKPKEPSARFQ